MFSLYVLFIRHYLSHCLGVCPLLSSTVPSGIWDSAPAAALKLIMTASFSSWLLKSKNNSTYSITTTISFETESGSITDIEDSSSSFMEVTLSFIVFMYP
jgi:hypothetical protein